MKWKIPSSFECGGRTWTVERPVKFDLNDGMGPRLGDCHPDKARIRVIQSKKTPLDTQNQVFWHEAFHACLMTAGHEELYADEEFVERVSQLIYQVIKSSR